MTEKDVFRVIKAVAMLLGDENLQDQLKDEERFKEALQKMRMPENARAELLNLLNRMECLKELAVDQDSSVPHAKAIPQSDQYEKMQLEAFDHIRTSFWIALGMSLALFFIGLLMMIIVVYQAVHQTSVSTSTLTIAGLGLADFVLLFFRRPWQDVSVNLSNSQQVRTVATSYLCGLALLERGDTKSIEMLNELTKRSVEMLEQYTEERDSISKRTLPKPLGLGKKRSSSELSADGL